MSTVINFWSPASPTEVKQLTTRRAALDKKEVAVGEANLSFARIPAPAHLQVRREFVIRYNPLTFSREVSERSIPVACDRPPATRLVSPRGLALRAYMTALFVMQAQRSAWEEPANKLRLDDRDDVSWVDLFATTATAKLYAHVRNKKVRQLQHALHRLASPEVQLIGLPNAEAKTGKCEGFVLLHESGAPYGEGPPNSRVYTIPGGERHILRLPAGLFRNGWIHLLEDSELTFLLMLAYMHGRFGPAPVFVREETRLLNFGLSRDAYESHRMLALFGLVEVHEDSRRFLEGGRATDFSEQGPPKLHRFELERSGFERDAATTLRAALNARLGED